MQLTGSEVASFQRVIMAYFAAHGRHDLPWRQPDARGTFDPYKILVSELMLQQTQVSRVTPKYNEFLAQFPSAKVLARASLGDVLIAWQGLGYNRRAKFLWLAAQKVSEECRGGIFPNTTEQLVDLPGVGKNTAGAIMNYAFNIPVAFVETNIRSVYIHHFFQDKQGIADKDILELVGQTLPKADARTWFWAIMDYGTYLKQTTGNASRASQGYKKQSPLKGSRREIRGKVLRLLATGKHELTMLEKEIDDYRLLSVLDDLGREEMIERNGTGFRLYH